MTTAKIGILSCSLVIWIRLVLGLENKRENQKYVLYAYRVLLTRARQGIVICVPAGNDRITPEGFLEDATRLPDFYNGTYEYLKSLGIKEL